MCRGALAQLFAVSRLVAEPLLPNNDDLLGTIEASTAGDGVDTTGFAAVMVGCTGDGEAVDACTACAASPRFNLSVRLRSALKSPVLEASLGGDESVGDRLVCAGELLPLRAPTGFSFGIDFMPSNKPLSFGASVDSCLGGGGRDGPPTTLLLLLLVINAT